jgi:hypothetical protein
MEDYEVDVPPAPLLELSMEQQLRLERMKRELPDVSREELQELALEFVKMTLVLQNNLSHVIKWAGRAKKEPTN